MMADTSTKKPRTFFTIKMGDFLPPPETPPTVCPKCARAVKAKKAVRRYNRATEQVQDRFGYCTCGYTIRFA